MNIAFYKIVLMILIFPLSIYCQSEKTISKERFDYLFDSLTTQKKLLLEQKAIILTEIDSLKNLLEELQTKLGSARVDGLIRKYGRELGNRVLQGQIWKGMTEKMLEDSWGKPDKINTNKEKWGVFTQWIYGNITYFFRDGVMIDWEEKN